MSWSSINGYTLPLPFFLFLHSPREPGELSQVAMTQNHDGRTRPTRFIGRIQGANFGAAIAQCIRPIVIACHADERRRRRHLIDSAAAEKKSIGAPPPPVKITRNAAAERMTSAQGSTWNSLPNVSCPHPLFLFSEIPMTPHGFSLQAFLPMIFIATFVVPPAQ